MALTPVGTLAIEDLDLDAGAPDATSPDARLLFDARAGDRQALEAIYQRFARSILRFLGDQFRDPHLAADATQETFDRAFRRLDTLRRPDRIGPWLFGIARFVYLEHCKSARRERPLSGAPDASESDSAPDPEQMLLAREAAGAVERTLAALPESRRAALLLRLDHGLSYQDIARTLGWSVAKAKIEVHRARLKLREEIARGDER